MSIYEEANLSIISSNRLSLTKYETYSLEFENKLAKIQSDSIYNFTIYSLSSDSLSKLIIIGINSE